MVVSRWLGFVRYFKTVVLCFVLLKFSVDDFILFNKQILKARHGREQDLLIYDRHIMTVIEEKWDYRLEIGNENFIAFESLVSNLRDEILNLNSFRVQNYDLDGRNHDDELKVLIERNKQLRQEIDTKAEELARQKTRYDCFKQDQELLSHEIKDTHEAFLMAKKYYKTFLKIYYKIESINGDKQTIFLQFFTESKTDSENYTLRLLRDMKTDRYELLETNPKIESQKELSKNLHETNDVPGVLCRVRQDFIKLRKSKKL